MPTLHLFNPENDLALGLDCRHYTPQPTVAQLRERWALLPMWWAADSDLVVGGDPGRARQLRETYGLHGVPVPRKAAAASLNAVTRFAPWGWSLDARRQFAEAGAEESALPCHDDLRRWRQLSSRATAVELLRRLDAGFPLPLVTADAGQALRMIADHPGCYVKSPWSGSGRGVFAADTLGREALRRRVTGIIHRQGSVVVERGLDKRTDFAALYHAGARGVEFAGLSVFSTAFEGAYRGNMVASQTRLAEEIGADFNPHTLLPHLNEMLHGYRGPLGVDMMVLRDGRVMPCVELNLRRTMGHVAMSVYDKTRPAQPRWLAF